MRHLKYYNEQNNLPSTRLNQKAVDDIKQTLNDILLELNDDGFTTDVIFNRVDNPYFRILIERNKDDRRYNASIFSIPEVKEVIFRMIDYMKSEGINTCMVEALDDQDDIFRDITPAFTNRLHKFLLKISGKNFKTRKIIVRFFT